MKKLIILISAIFLSCNVFAQIPTYTDSIYPVAIQYDIKYGSTRNVLHLTQILYMDIYTPVGLDYINKPCILLFHGGGLVVGSKNDARLVAEAKYLAGCGYVVFIVDYRLGWNLLLNNATLSIRNSHNAYYRAVQDGFTAVRYAKYYSDSLNIDVNNVFVAGTSAGGLISVGIGYLDQNEVDSYYTNQIKTSGNNLTKYESTDIKGVISYWGGMFDTTIFQGETVPNICFHGLLDEVVYYNEGLYKGLIPIYGGYKINKMCNENNVPSLLHTFPNAHHGVNVNSPQWDTCVNMTVAWLYCQINSCQYPKLEVPIVASNSDNKLIIYDIMGRTVFNGLMDDYPKLPNGLYIKVYQGKSEKILVIEQ